MRAYMFTTLGLHHDMLFSLYNGHCALEKHVRYNCLKMMMKKQNEKTNMMMMMMTTVIDGDNDNENDGDDDDENDNDDRDSG